MGKPTWSSNRYAPQEVALARAKGDEIDKTVAQGWITYITHGDTERNVMTHIVYLVKDPWGVEGSTWVTYDIANDVWKCGTSTYSSSLREAWKNRPLDLASDG